MTSKLERKETAADKAKEQLANFTKTMDENLKDLGVLEDAINEHSNTTDTMLFNIEKIILFDQLLKEIKKLLDFSIHEDDDVQEQLKIASRDFALFLKTFEMEMDNIVQLTRMLDKLEQELDAREEDTVKLEEYLLLLQEVEMLREEVAHVEQVADKMTSDIGNVTCINTDIESKREMT